MLSNKEYIIICVYFNLSESIYNKLHVNSFIMVIKTRDKPKIFRAFKILNKHKLWAKIPDLTVCLLMNQFLYNKM